MTALVWQTALWCLLGFVVGAVAAYLVALIIAPSAKEALAALDERDGLQPREGAGS